MKARGPLLLFNPLWFIRYMSSGCFRVHHFHLQAKHSPKSGESSTEKPGKVKYIVKLLVKVVLNFISRRQCSETTRTWNKLNKLLSQS